MYASPLSSSVTSEVLVKPSLLPYPSPKQKAQEAPAFSRLPVKRDDGWDAAPVGIAISQWHWLLLYSDRIVGIARETEKVVFDEKLPLVSRTRGQAVSRLTKLLGTQRESDRSVR